MMKEKYETKPTYGVSLEKALGWQQGLPMPWWRARHWSLPVLKLQLLNRHGRVFHRNSGYSPTGNPTWVDLTCSPQGLLYEAAKAFGLLSRKLKLFLNETHRWNDEEIPRKTLNLKMYVSIFLTIADFWLSLLMCFRQPPPGTYLSLTHIHWTQPLQGHESCAAFGLKLKWDWPIMWLGTSQ